LEIDNKFGSIILRATDFMSLTLLFFNIRHFNFLTSPQVSLAFNIFSILKD